MQGEKETSMVLDGWWLSSTAAFESISAPAKTSSGFKLFITRDSSRRTWRSLCIVQLLVDLDSHENAIEVQVMFSCNVKFRRAGESGFYERALEFIVVELLRNVVRNFRRPNRSHAGAELLVRITGLRQLLGHSIKWRPNRLPYLSRYIFNVGFSMFRSAILENGFGIERELVILSLPLLVADETRYCQALLG